MTKIPAANLEFRILINAGKIFSNPETGTVPGFPVDFFFMNKKKNCCLYKFVQVCTTVFITKKGNI